MAYFARPAMIESLPQCFHFIHPCVVTVHPLNGSWESLPWRIADWLHATENHCPPLLSLRSIRRPGCGVVQRGGCYFPSLFPFSLVAAKIVSALNMSLYYGHIFVEMNGLGLILLNLFPLPIQNRNDVVTSVFRKVQSLRVGGTPANWDASLS